MADSLMHDTVCDAVGLVLAKMHADEEGARLLLDDLDRSELERVAGSLAAVLGALGPRALHGEGTFIAMLHVLQDEV